MNVLGNLIAAVVTGLVVWLALMGLEALLNTRLSAPATVGTVTATLSFMRVLGKGVDE